MKEFDEAEFLPADFLAEPQQGYDANRDFTSLTCWQQCHAVKLWFYQYILPALPQTETYALGQQIRRAATSTTLNIAEGYGRFHHRESMQFYRVARGSLYELKGALITCKDLDFVEKDLFHQSIQEIEQAKILLNGYINYIKKRLETDKKA